MGHAHRPYRHPESVRLQPAPGPEPEHEPAAIGIHRRYPGHGRGAEQQRDRHAGDVIRGSGLDGHDPGLGNHARCRCRHCTDGQGAYPGPFMALAVADIPGCDLFSVAQANARGPAGPGRHRPGSDHSGAGTDRSGGHPHHPGSGCESTVRLIDRRHPARCFGWRSVRHGFVLQPGGSAADSHPGRR
ncbi:hypothetical protein D3C79_767840 [compost metagenome]